MDRRRLIAGCAGLSLSLIAKAALGEVAKAYKDQVVPDYKG